MSTPAPPLPAGGDGAGGGLTALLERTKAFAAANGQWNHELMVVLAGVSASPAGSLAKLDGLWTQLEALEASQLALAADMGDIPHSDPAAIRSYWLRERATLLNFRWMAANRAGLRDKMVETTRRAREAFAAVPDDPFWAEIEERDAELAVTTTEVERLLDSAFARRAAAGAWLEAGRNRMRAAALAGVAARFERQRSCADAGVAIADTHELRREQIWFRVNRFTMLLIGDRSGAARDEASGQLDFTWEPTGALPGLLKKVYGDAAAILDGPASGGVAAAMVQSFGLGREAHEIASATDAAGLQAACVAAAAALEAQRASQWFDLLLLCAQWKISIGEPRAPLEDILPMALPLAVAPEQLCRVHSAFADGWEARGKLLRAVAAASDAVEAVRVSGPATTRAQAMERLQSLRAQAGEPAEALARDPALDVEDYVTRRGQAAQNALQAGSAGDALAIVDDALPLAATAAQEASLRMLRAVTLEKLRRLPEAEPELVMAAEKFTAAFEADPSCDGSLLQQTEAAWLLLAFVRARLGQALPAWDALQQARARMLRGRLGLQAAAWPAVREALRRQNAALLEVCVLMWGTLVVTASALDDVPVVEFSPDFRAADLGALLVRPGLGDDSDAWTAVLMGAMPGLSAALAPMLSERLVSLAADADVLYVVPAGPLFHAPLAALQLADGRTLAELMPFAVLPFASLLLADAGQPQAAPGAVALAFGKDLTGFDFVEHLTTLAPELQAFSATTFAGEEATAARLQQGVETAAVVYLSSHGTLNHEVQELERASALILAGGSVTAADVAGWRWPQPGHATLSLLNACQSGRFRALTLTEAGGFPGAFLRGGRWTLVAPVTHVDPAAAVALAAELLSAVRAGASVAGALRDARLVLKQRGLPAAAWAAHLLFGLDARVCC